MIFDVAKNTNITPPSVVLRCPRCRQLGTFATITQADQRIARSGRPAVVAGHRRCPDEDCRCHVFFVLDDGEVTAYPPEVIDFDTSDIPVQVVGAMDEALKCHSNECFTASAIMVRKTLEMLCADRGAEGKNLKKRIAALAEKVVLPKELLAALDDLRLLGNDAAHIDAETFNDVGKKEVEVAIDVAKEVLKATYQYEGLIQRLRALKKADDSE